MNLTKEGQNVLNTNKHQYNEIGLTISGSWLIMKCSYNVNGS